MPNFTNILFPVDFSEPCRAVAPIVSSLTRHFAARLTLLHCIEIPPGSYMPHSSRFVDELKVRVRKTVKASMLSFIKQECASLSVKWLIEEGDPGNRIVEHTQKQGTDLVMMPTHGYGSFRRFLIGSVAARVLHDVQCPVWTAAHTEEGPSKGKSDYQTIICAVDSGESSIALMQWASSLAAQFHANLKLVHVVPAVDEESANRDVAEVRRYLFSKAREEFAAWQQRAGVNAELVLRGGNVASAIAEAAKREKADVVVVGRGRIQRALGGLRAHSLPIIREAPCPVFSV